MSRVKMDTLTRRRDYVIFSIILLIALGVRLWHLGDKSLWRDEGSSLMFASRSLAQIVTNTKETNPPLYYALLHGWIALFGTSEVALRFLSVVCGVLAVALTGWVGDILGGKRLAWLSMGLMAIMPMPVEYAQMARTYSLFLAASLASYGCLMKWETQRQRSWAVGYVVATIVMSYAHYYWVFNVLAQQFYMFWQIYKKRVDLRQWLGISVAILLGALPWLVVLVSQTVKTPARVSWLQTPDIKELAKALHSFVAFGVPQPLPWFYFFLTGLGVLKIRMADGTEAQGQRVNTLRMSRWRIRLALHRMDGLLLLWVVCSVFVPFVWSLLRKPIFHSRYTIAATAALYLFVARGILEIPGRVGKGLVIAAITVSAAMSLSHYYAWQHEAWRPLVATVKRLAETGDVITVQPGGAAACFVYYYRGEVPVHSLPAKIDGRNAAKFDHSMQDILAGHRHLWMVIHKSGSTRKQALSAETFLAHFPDARLIYERKFRGEIMVYGYELPPHVAPKEG